MLEAAPVEDLRAAGLDPAFEALERAIANYRAGESENVAVVSDPFAGREALLDYAAERLETDADRLELTGLADGPVRIPDSDVVVVDGCHYLHRREIGGFDALDSFLESVALSGTFVVTGWNRYAWDYLDAVRDVSRSFSEVVRIPELDAADVGHLVESSHEGPMPTFEETSKDGRIKTLNVERKPVRVWGPKTVSVPVPKPNPEWVSSWSVAGESESIEAVVYEKVRRVSHGNPGIATTVWDDAVTNGEIAPAYVQSPVDSFRISDPEAFLLWFVVSNESVALEELHRSAPDVAVEETLHELANEDVVTIDDGTVEITPLGLHPAVEELARRRFVW
jgi:hypothetical protein